MPAPCRSMSLGLSSSHQASLLSPPAAGWRLAGCPLPPTTSLRHCTGIPATPAAISATCPLMSSPRPCAHTTSATSARHHHHSPLGHLPTRPGAGVGAGAAFRAASRRAAPAAPLTALPEALVTLAASPYRDYYVVAAAAVGAAVWVKVFDVLAANGTLEQKLSRKVVHTTTGPLFVLTWALFSASPVAKLLAAAVPMINFARLLAVGSGLVSDPGLVNSVSRSGDRTELLKGPLFYVVTLVAATVLCWRDNPAGLIAVSMMCGGDGLADIVGRRWGGGAKLPYNPTKSWAGSAAMLVGGYGMSYGLITLFCSLGFFTCYPPASMVGCLGAIALAATVVESLPVNQWIDDNLSVPMVAAGLSLVLLPQPAEAAAALAAAAVPVATGLVVTAAAAVSAAASGQVGMAV